MAAGEAGGVRAGLCAGPSGTLTTESNGLTSMPSRLASAMPSQVMDCGAVCVM